MTTIKIQSQANWANDLAPQKADLWHKWLAITDSQAERNTLWFMISMIVQGVLFLPLPAVLIYYYNAPTLILVVTLSLFFANIITGMSGSGIRTTLSLFLISIIVQLSMLIVFML
ncbi:hypothetical protein [Mucilaginibacter sp. UR6-11]|uniref:hypothetical protein n=1 Tax=Mucilaginibacter sp. UR6-11 TaxID=1435644 RepID=UPI001E370880|nr:hypothetical protein [Mucilaginibacter sp. UR6-11]MCC8424911.1 hypothetical protein [Mucilaginibacter sp. UR6-11]